jgi:hypothetical protein
VKAAASGGLALLVVNGELAGGLDGWNTFDTDKKLKTKAGQQTQETAVFFVTARR